MIFVFHYKSKIANELYTNKKTRNPQLYKHILPSEAIKRQPYKQILIVYMAGNQYIARKFES